jgi:hypothetical protein
LTRSRTAADRYREDAARFRQRAAGVILDDRLRDNYLALASKYAKLAGLLEPVDSAPTAAADPPSRFTKRLRIVAQVVRTLLRDVRGLLRPRRLAVRVLQ